MQHDLSGLTMQDGERVVHIAIDGESYATLEGRVDLRALYFAIGRLSSWGRERYPLVTIYSPRPQDGELVAAYREEPNGSVGYVIGAVYDVHENTYSFHS